MHMQSKTLKSTERQRNAKSNKAKKNEGMKCNTVQRKAMQTKAKSNKTKAKQNKSKHIKGKQSNEIAVHRKQPSTRGLTYGWELTVGSIDARTSFRKELRCSICVSKRPFLCIHCPWGPGFPFFFRIFPLESPGHQDASTRSHPLKSILPGKRSFRFKQTLH